MSLSANSLCMYAHPRVHMYIIVSHVHVPLFEKKTSRELGTADDIPALLFFFKFSESVQAFIVD